MYIQSYIINLQGRELEWDDAKNKLNIVKHGMDFEDSYKIFANPVVAHRDERMSYGEERWIAFGKLEGRTVTIVYTFREERIRIISMRKGSQNEREAYKKEIRINQGT